MLGFIYQLSYTGKAFNSEFSKSLILVQMILYFSYSLSVSIQNGINLSLLFLSLSPSLSLKVLTQQLISSNIKTNNDLILITSSKYLMKYLEFFFRFNPEITLLLTSSFYWFFGTLKFFFCYFCHTKSQHYYTVKKSLCFS